MGGRTRCWGLAVFYYLKKKFEQCKKAKQTLILRHLTNFNFVAFRVLLI